MGDKSRIEWTEATWNPTVGCSKASIGKAPSPGCDHCYAIRQAHRIQSMGTTDAYDGTTRVKGNGEVDWTGVVKCLPERLEQPLRWKRPRRIFVNSMSDLFHPSVPFEFVDKVFAVMALTPHHTYQVLTKRPERMAEYLGSHDTALRIFEAGSAYMTEHLVPVTQDRFEVQRDLRTGKRWPLPNVWLGTSVENQEAANERIPHLLRCPAAVRFLSCEPLLGPVDLRPFLWPGDRYQQIGEFNEYEDTGSPIGWVIVGGESGPGARQFNVRWARSLLYQCENAEVAFFLKQLGSLPYMPHPFEPDDYRLKLVDRKGGDWSEWPEDLRVREIPLQEVPA